MTNKPEVLGFFVEWSCNNEEGEFKLSLDHFTTRDDYCSIFGGGCRLVPVIRLSDYEALQAECEQLRKDAERYRWLRLGAHEDSDLDRWEHVGYVCGVSVCTDYGVHQTLDAEALDSAIDAAMQQEEDQQ